MFALVYLPNFELQAALRHEPELWTKPVALVDPARSTPAVCDVTALAHDAGVVAGLTPTQALARCRDVIVRHRSPAQENAATEALLQCAYGFSPYLENTAPGVCTLDLRGLAELKNADSQVLAAWAGRLRILLSGLNLRARIGVGLTPNLARHAARWSDGIEIVSNPQAFVSSLPVAALGPSSDVTVILGKWGIRTVGELLALGQEALVDRLGLEALALFAAASTTATRPLNLVTPTERFEETIDFDHEIETLEPLLFILRRFVDQLSQRLALTGVVAETLTLRLRLASAEVIERRLRIPAPTCEADILFRMLHTHLETLRTESPIASFALTASPGQPEQKQFGLFEVALRDRNQFQETLARLVGLLGADRVGTPILDNTHRPGAFRLLPPDFENASAVAVDRKAASLRPLPIRRFRPSIRAQVQTSGPANAPTDGSIGPLPISLRCSADSGRIRVAVGPWRASGNWWEPGAWQREEWDVEGRHGAIYRLACEPDGWKVEGVLD